MEEGTYEAAMAAKTGGEVVKTGRIVGAEKERAALEKLLVRRCEWASLFARETGGFPPRFLAGALAAAAALHGARQKHPPLPLPLRHRY